MPHPPEITRQAVRVPGPVGQLVGRLTLHILAAVAEYEREMISQRTRAALAAAKARGTRLGNPRPDMMKTTAQASRQATMFRDKMAPLVMTLQSEGRTLRGVAAELNARGIASAHGRLWHAASVRVILRQTAGA